MTIEDVQNEARKFDGVTTYRPNRANLADMVVKRGGTRIHCYFKGSRLDSVQVTWVSKPMELTTEPRRQLCATAAMPPAIQNLVQ